MPLATLSIDIVAKLASLEQSLDKAYRLNEKAAAQIESRWAKMNAAAVTFGKTLAGAFAVREFVRFTNQTIDAIDALNDAKDATGATIENLSALEDVARRNGGTLDDVTGILVKFNAALKEADGKNTISQAIQAIGLSATELRQLDPAEAVRRVAVALTGFADDGNKARLVQELFGKSVQKAAPFLKDLAEAGKLNATVTTKQADEAEKFNKNLAALQTNASNAARALTSQLVPALSEMLEAFNKANAQSGFLSGVRAALDNFGDRMGWFTRAQAEFKKNIKPLESDVDSLTFNIDNLKEAIRADPTNPGLPPALDRLQKELDAKTAALSKAREEFIRVSTQAEFSDARFAAAQPNDGKNAPPKLPDLLSATKRDGLDSIDRAMDDFQKRLDRWKELNEEALDQAEEQERALSLQQPNLAEDSRRDAVSAQFERQRQAIADMNAALAATPAAQVEQLKGLLESLESASAAGNVDPTKAAEAIEAVSQSIKQLKAQQGDLDAALELQLGDNLRKALQGDWKGILQDWENLILEMIAKAASAELLKRLFGQGNGANGTWGAIFSFLFSKNGNAFDASGVMPFANGGVVNAATMFGFGGGRMGIMGEAGPEAILPLRRGRDGRLGVASGGGYVDNRIENLHVGSNVSLADVHAVVNQALAAQEARLARRGREGRA